MMNNEVMVLPRNATLLGIGEKQKIEGGHPVAWMVVGLVASPIVPPYAKLVFCRTYKAPKNRHHR